jgi:hypothetical protein
LCLQQRERRFSHEDSSIDTKQTKGGMAVALIRVVYVPGSVPTLSSLCPRPVLMEAVGQLCEKGFQTDLRHYGALPETMASGRSPSEDLSSLPPAWITVFYVETRADYEEVRRTSSALHKAYPDSLQLLAGPYAVHFSHSLLADISDVDGIITDDFSTVLCEVASSLRERRSLPVSDGLLVRSGTHKTLGKEQPRLAPIASFPPKKRMHRDSFFQLYPLSFSKGPANFYYHDTRQKTRRRKSSSELFDEIKWLHDCHGAVAFQLDAAHASLATVTQLARKLLTHNLMILYSLGEIRDPFPRETAQLLVASGCRSMGFRIPTASQRLLEDYYGLDVSISALAKSLRHCRDAGLFTVVHLTAPSPLDDRHSVAETELFLESSRPSAIQIETPSLVPDSLWFCHSRHFGFSLDYKKYQKHLDPTRLPFHLSGRWNMRRLSFVHKVISESARKQSILLDAGETEGLLLRMMGIEGVGASSLMLRRLSQSLLQRDMNELSTMIQKFNARAAQVLSGDLLTASSLAGKVAVL